LQVYTEFTKYLLVRLALLSAIYHAENVKPHSKMVEPHPEKVKLYFKMAQAPTEMVKPHSKTSKPHPKMVQPHTETDKSHQEIGKTQLVCNLSVFGLFFAFASNHFV
jgi:hypothetical protein